MDEKTQQEYLDEMSQKMPITYRMVLDRINMYQTELYNAPKIAGTPKSITKKAPNEKPLGTREKDKVKLRNKPKTRGQTRGTP